MNSSARRLVSVLVLVAVWEGAVRLGLVPAFFLAAPSTILFQIVKLVESGVLPQNAGASMIRMLSGYLLALASGVVVGGLMGWFRWADDVLDPLVELVRPVSPLAILPLAILWLGIGQASKIFVIWYACIFPVLLNTYAAVRSVPKSTIEAAWTLGASPDEVLRRVVFFHCLPPIFTGARISFAVGMIVIIAAEMVAADRGLGYMILTAQQDFQTADLYAGIVTIAAIGFVGDRFIRWLRTRICPWYVEIEQT
ncbi:MAG TPA: ABC transporter permease [Stellaceae bacterium]|nr:ABC transporter permease [Stellaceae bacterium]